MPETPNSFEDLIDRIVNRLDLNDGQETRLREELTSLPPQTAAVPARQDAVLLVQEARKAIDDLRESQARYEESTRRALLDDGQDAVPEPLEQSVFAKDAEIKASGYREWQYACPYCLDGYVSIQSSITEAMVHPDTPVGRVICEGRDKPTVFTQPPQTAVGEGIDIEEACRRVEAMSGTTPGFFWKHYQAGTLMGSLLIQLELMKRLMASEVAHREAIAQRDEARKVAEQVKQQAEIWAQEARTHKHSLLEAYKAVGATGLADFHGAEPIRQYVRAAEAKLAAVDVPKPESGE